MLPFETNPKQEFGLVGNTLIGVLKFPVYFGLLVSEQIEIDTELNQSTPFVLAAELACKIQHETGSTDLLLCSEVILGGDSESKESAKFISEQRIRYARQVQSINNYSETFSYKEKLATVTAICKRISPDWNASDTKQLSAKLFEAIWQFALLEINPKVDSKPDTKLTEEDIKKPQGDRPNPPIGQASTGESNPTGDMIPDSIAETSPNNLAG